jgi:hypothetical protein
MVVEDLSHVVRLHLLRSELTEDRLELLAWDTPALRPVLGVPFAVKAPSKAGR